MTAQIHDIIFFEGDAYAICGVRGKGLFEPAESGWAPITTNTACARGFNCIYGVVDGWLDLGMVNLGGQMISPEADQSSGDVLEGHDSTDSSLSEPALPSMNDPIGRQGPVDGEPNHSEASLGNDGLDLPIEDFTSPPNPDDFLHCQLPGFPSRSDIQVPSKPPFTGSLLLGAKYIEDLYVHMGFKAPYTFEEVIELTFDNGRLLEVVDRSEEMAAIRIERGSDGEGGWKDPDLWVEGSFSLDY